MYGYIYETTCLVNGKKYIGQHKSSKFEGTKYLGSGTKLVEAIQKYGKQNFTVRMLQSCNSFEELEVYEVHYIEKYNAIQNTDYYNIALGGYAGGGYVIPSLESRKKMSISAKKRGNCLTPEGKLRCRHVGIDNGFYQKVHSEETKKYLSTIHKGRIWVNNGRENLHIRPEDLEKYLSEGYCRGMKPKHHDTSGRIWIHEESSGKRKMIFRSELKNYPNWKLGVGKRVNSPCSSETIESITEEKAFSE